MNFSTETSKILDNFNATFLLNHPRLKAGGYSLVGESRLGLPSRLYLEVGICGPLHFLLILDARRYHLFTYVPHARYKIPAAPQIPAPKCFAQPPIIL